MSLLIQEKERFIQRRLAEASLSQFAYGAIEPVRQMILTQRLDGELRNLRDYLVETCEIMGERFPEYDQWKTAGDREREEHFRQLEEVSGDPQRMLLFAMQKAKDYFGSEDEEATPLPKPPAKQFGVRTAGETGLALAGPKASARQSSTSAETTLALVGAGRSIKNVA